MQITLRKTT